MVLSQKIQWFVRGTSPAARRARLGVKIAFLLVLFAGLFWIVPVDRVLTALISTNPRLFLIGLSFSILSTLLNAVELVPLIRKQGLQHRVDEVLEINLAVKFYSLFMPGSIVGSGYRWYRLSQPGGKPAQALAAMAFFRTLETFLNITFGMSFLVLSGQQIAPGWVWLLIVGIVLGWFGLTRWSLPIYHWFKAHLGWLWRARLLKWGLRYLEKFLLALTDYADMPLSGLAIAVFSGVISLLAGAVSNLIIARSIGIDLSFLTMGWIYAVVILAAQLPFAFAGGLGIREVTLVAIMPTVGVSTDLALAFSFLLFVRGLIISVFGGILESIRILGNKRKSEPREDVRKTEQL
jgi:uncharacterized membrane protein YbhN (UPF0104 family)